MKVVWIGVVNPQLNVFEVSFEGNRIIQQETETEGKPGKAKWVFKDITRESFTWEAYQSEDNGQHWNLTQEVFATRKQ